MKEIKNPTLEALKELGRWAILIAVSWVITETVNQIGNVPETYDLKVVYFVYSIPVRLLFQLALASLGRYIDRLIHESKKIKLSGLLPF